MKDVTQKHYFTFMYEQHELHNKYVCMEGDWMHSRMEMFKYFGDQWAFQYTQEEFNVAVEKFSLIEHILGE